MKKSTSLLFFGIVAGVAIGATLGILFAPDKGSNTRKKLRMKADALKKDIDAGLDDLNEQYEGAYDDEVTFEEKENPVS